MIYNISQFKVFDFRVFPLLKHKNLVPLCSFRAPVEDFCLQFWG